MDYTLSCIEIDNFKSYATPQKISVSDMSVFLGANSSGKSTAIQTLLAIKQTMECNSHDIELLLSGQYVALGDYDDVINDKSKDGFSIGLDFRCIKKNETTDVKDSYSIKWFFKKASDESQAKLESVEITYEDRCILLTRMEHGKYQLSINGNETPVFMQVRNMRLTGNFFLKYDIIFNRLFAEFINEMKIIVEGKKTGKIAVDSLVSPKVVPKFYMGLMNDNLIKNQDVSGDTEAERIAGLLTDLIEKYSLQQSPLGSEYFGFPMDLKKNCMLAIIKNSGKMLEFKEVYEKYLQKYDQYIKEAKEVSSFEGEETMPRFLVSHSFNDDSNLIMDSFRWASSFYDEFEEAIGNLYFVGPIRENPKGLYSIGFEQDPKYVGATGSNFASVLLHENKIKKYILPYNEEDSISLWEALNEWSSHLNIASAIEVSHATSFGIKVSVSDTQNKTADIMNVGIGTSQVLPVLITGLLSEKNETLVFEQPELHLHPFSQSRLADFFIALIKHGRKIIVETHSESFILRLRYHVLKENCGKDLIAINFFQNRQGTKVSLCNISGYGNIDYPDDFRDETQELLNDLMNAALKKEV